MALRLKHTAKFGIYFDRNYKWHKEMGDLTKERNFILEYEQENIEIKYTVRLIYLAIIIIFSGNIISALLVYNYILSLIYMGITIIATTLYIIQIKKLKIACISKNIAELAYTELINEKYNLG